MKRVISIVLCLVAVLFSAVVVQAENAVSVWAKNVEVKNNRLFDVDIYVDCSFSLTAATFEISYDKAMMEYREVRTEIANAQVKGADINGKVKAIFLKNDGTSENGKIKLFSAKFKAISEGACNVGISMYDCVDNNALGTNDEASAQITVAVLGSQASAVGDNDEKRKTDNTLAKEETTKPKSIKHLSVASPDDNDEYLFIILLLVLIIIGLMFYSAKLKKDKEKATSKPPEINSKNQNEAEENLNPKDEPTEKEIVEEDSTEVAE